MSYKYRMQVAPRASSRGTSLANLESLQPDQKKSSKVAGLAVDGIGGGKSNADDEDEQTLLALRVVRDAGVSLGNNLVLVVKHPSSLTREGGWWGMGIDGVFLLCHCLV